MTSSSSSRTPKPWILWTADVLANPQSTAAAHDQVVVTVIVQVAEGRGTVYPVLKRSYVSRLARIGLERGIKFHPLRIEGRIGVCGRIALLRELLARQEPLGAATEPGDFARVILAGDHVLVAVVVQVVEHRRKADAAPLRDFHDGAFGIPAPTRTLGKPGLRIRSHVRIDANR